MRGDMQRSKGKSAVRKSPQPKVKRTNRWSAQVTRTSDALDLPAGIFTQRSASAIARQLKRAAESSHRRKSTPFQSAMSMLNFQINRGGKGLPARQKHLLNQAKQKLRVAFGRA